MSTTIYSSTLYRQHVTAVTKTCVPRFVALLDFCAVRCQDGRLQKENYRICERLTPSLGPPKSRLSQQRAKTTGLLGWSGNILTVNVYLQVSLFTFFKCKTFLNTRLFCHSTDPFGSLKNSDNASLLFSILKYC